MGIFEGEELAAVNAALRLFPDLSLRVALRLFFWDLDSDVSTAESQYDLLFFFLHIWRLGICVCFFFPPEFLMLRFKVGDEFLKRVDTVNGKKSAQVVCCLVYFITSKVVYFFLCL